MTTALIQGKHEEVFVTVDDLNIHKHIHKNLKHFKSNITCVCCEVIQQTRMVT